MPFILTRHHGVCPALCSCNPNFGCLQAAQRSLKTASPDLARLSLSASPHRDEALDPTSLIDFCWTNFSLSMSIPGAELKTGCSIYMYSSECWTEHISSISWLWSYWYMLVRWLFEWASRILYPTHYNECLVLCILTYSSILLLIPYSFLFLYTMFHLFFFFSSLPNITCFYFAINPNCTATWNQSIVLKRDLTLFWDKNFPKALVW